MNSSDRKQFGRRTGSEQHQLGVEHEADGRVCPPSLLFNTLFFGLSVFNEMSFGSKWRRRLLMRLTGSVSSFFYFLFRTTADGDSHFYTETG